MYCKEVEYKNFTIKVFTDEDDRNMFLWEIWKNKDCLDSSWPIYNFTDQEMAIADAKKEIDDDKWIKVFGDDSDFFS